MIWASPSIQSWSLHRRLMVGILLPMLLVIGTDALVLYRQALRFADTAYDRTLLATAKSIGDLLEVSEAAGQARLKSTMLYSALEPFEADNRSRLYYRVTGLQGEMVSGFEALRPWRGHLPDRGPYAALVDFYDDQFDGVPVRVAVLLQPVVWPGGQGMATVQVAETLELRQALARTILTDTLWRQGALLLLLGLVVTLVVHWATKPVRDLSSELDQRQATDLSALTATAVPADLQPLVAANNHLMQRLRSLLNNQKRFVRDTAHQLRTPLAVLKVQVQSAQRGDLPPEQALAEIAQTVERATTLANQMLALAKIEQMQQDSDAPLVDWSDIVRDVALDLAPLMVEQALEFELVRQPAQVRSHEWPLRELTRNLLHNAIKASPKAAGLHLVLHTEGHQAKLTISDHGPGLSEMQQARLFQPFSSGDPARGSGLGLSICEGIVKGLGGSIRLHNRLIDGQIQGLDAEVWIPLSDNPHP